MWQTGNTGTRRTQSPHFIRCGSWERNTCIITSINNIRGVRNWLMVSFRLHRFSQTQVYCDATYVTVRPQFCHSSGTVLWQLCDSLSLDMWLACGLVWEWGTCTDYSMCRSTVAIDAAETQCESASGPGRDLCSLADCSERL